MNSNSEKIELNNLIVVILEKGKNIQINSKISLEIESVINETTKLVNSEWSRSFHARKQFLSWKSSESDLPISAVCIIKDESNEELNGYRVIGHARLSNVSTIGHENCGLIESVVVNSSYRRKGYGKLVMVKAQEYGKKIGLKEIHLSTNDQENFYKSLNYKNGEIVTKKSNSNQHTKASQNLELFLGANINQKTPKDKYWMVLEL